MGTHTDLGLFELSGTVFSDCVIIFYIRTGTGWDLILTYLSTGWELTLTQETVWNTLYPVT
jgi:hypothetical protein